ncbi:MAG TPA: GIY-YIG nuclease family protein [Niabella sp.]|nr:GIY-YIG nuclease family protein [Niabella sp.]HOZ96307.1 GIY-YIG nuclease family protein [Niabella sp.]HQW14617.1 GIY-YIG nuclease family protein [Niabella sp.]HQX19758.1 GIY-YIG nuclease family protein [Niabella sp.]HQX42749.1 GIY-YIG nuclease family protein [Niabella sp.]
MAKGGFIYILTNKNKTVLYIGVTSNLRQRIWQHETHFYKNSFTARYNVEFLTYYEWFDYILTAIYREKELKKWRREKKDALIVTKNPDWRFLNEEVHNDIYSLLY